MLTERALLRSWWFSGLMHSLQVALGAPAAAGGLLLGPMGTKGWPTPGLRVQGDRDGVDATAEMGSRLQFLLSLPRC